MRTLALGTDKRSSGPGLCECLIHMRCRPHKQSLGTFYQSKGLHDRPSFDAVEVDQLGGCYQFTIRISRQSKSKNIQPIHVNQREEN